MSRYGAARYGSAAYGDGPSRGAVAGGSYAVEVAYHRAAADNTRLEDVSGILENGQVKVQMGQPVPGSLSADCREVRRLAPYRDWVAPVLTVVTTDAAGRDLRVSEQLGLYLLLPPKRTWLPSHGTEAVSGVDAVWLLATSQVSRPYSVAGGNNVGVAMEELCRDVGARHAIQATAQVMAKRRTWPAGTTRLAIFNDLARSIGFLPAWADRVGRIRSRRYQRLGAAEPARRISSRAGMVVETITEDTDWARLCNEVTVLGNDPKGRTVRAYRINRDPRSPTSTVNLGTPGRPRVLPKVVEDPNIDDQEAADALADRLMDQGSSVFVRWTVSTVPLLDWEPHDVSALAIETDGGEPVAAGACRFDELTQGLGVDATTTWRFNKLVGWQDVAA